MSESMNTRLSKVWILGDVEEVDEDAVKNRIKISQRIIAVNALLDTITYILWSMELFAEQNFVALIAIFFFSFWGMAGFLMLYYGNLSLKLIKRLFQEVNVIVVLIGGVLIFVIDIFKPGHPITSRILGFVYLFFVYAVLFFDAVKIKARIPVLIIGILFSLTTLFNIYIRSIGKTDIDVILFHGFYNDPWYKRSIKRSVFIQIFLFSFNGVWTIFFDKKMELMMFATSNIYKSSGTQEKNTAAMEKNNDDLIETINPLMSIEMSIEITSVNSSDEHGTTKIACHSNETKGATKRSSIMLLGVETQVDYETTKKRIRIGQQIILIFSFFAIVTFVINHAFLESEIISVTILTLACGAIVFSGVCMLFYKNISFAISLRLLKELNVLVLFVSGLLNWIIDIYRPSSVMSPVYGFLYFLATLAILSMDAIILKDRRFALAICTLFSCLTLFNLYQCTIGSDKIGDVIFYGFNKMPFYNRSVKRSIFLNIALFSVSGIWILIFDKKMEFMIFATGRIYRHTGTSSPEIREDSSSAAT
jgi:hypothetical protein